MLFLTYSISKTENYLNETGVGDTAYFGNEPEFFVFDNVKWDTGFGLGKAFYEIHSEEADWESGSDFEGGNKGHRPRIKGGYFPVPPVDSLHDLRSQMCLAIEEMGVTTEVHHHEVGTAVRVGGRIGKGIQRLSVLNNTTNIVKCHLT
jgi:glutamine synthetase